MRILWIVLIFFSMGALLIISNNNLAFYQGESVLEFGKLFIGWLDQIYNNFQTVTGNVIELEWVPS